MTGTAPHLRFLAAIPAFAALSPGNLQSLYRACALKVLAKGEAAVVAGEAVEELGIVISGRLTGIEPGGGEYGPGSAVTPRAFFTRRPACETAVALRETVLLTLAFEDFLDAIRNERELLEEFLARSWRDESSAEAPPKLSRLVIAPAGSLRRLDPTLLDTLLSAFESAGEIRLLSRQSFGGGLPGAISLDAPETAQWLQELELEFDLTVMPVDETDIGFALEAIEEADSVLFIASGGDPALSALEEHALRKRGGGNCRLLIVRGAGSGIANAGAWAAPRPYRSKQSIDFSSGDARHILALGLLGKGCSVAAASRGVYAAAILGALEALDVTDCPAVSLAAAGSAILPAGLVACGARPGFIKELFQELANPLFWKRAYRTETGLCDPAPLDNFLAGALRGFDIGRAARPFASLALSFSNGSLVSQSEGRLYEPVRASLAPPGLFPPLVLGNGDILTSAEGEAAALASTARALSPAPALQIYAVPRGLGISPLPYKTVAALSRFKLFKIETPPATPVNLRLENVLACAGPAPNPAGIPALALPVDGIGPMDWGEWDRLRARAYEHVVRELDRKPGA